MNLFYTLFVTLLVFLALSSPVNADYAKGLEAAKKGDFAIAYNEWMDLAEKGHAAAQFSIGVMYDEGQGVSQDNAEAVYWYRKSAEQDNIRAQLNLGFMYEQGKGVSKDPGVAMEWYKKAAKQNNAKAQLNIGLMYDKGKGVEADPSKAVKWYKKAAKQGVGAAHYSLGVMYYRGQGVRKDLVESYAWFNLAAEKGIESGTRVKALIEKEMKPKKIKEAKKLARRYKRKYLKTEEEKTKKSMSIQDQIEKEIRKK